MADAINLSEPGIAEEEAAARACVRAWRLDLVTAGDEEREREEEAASHRLPGAVDVEAALGDRAVADTDLAAGERPLVHRREAGEVSCAGTLRPV